MKTLYARNELLFAAVCIGAYLVLGTAANLIGKMIGVPSGEVVSYAVLTVVLLWFIRKNGLSDKYGLRRPTVPAKRFLWFVPLLVLCSVNLWLGVAIRDTAAETITAVLSMVFVGTLEELLFRGLLFRGLQKRSLKAAFTVSALAFGLLHLLNLMKGTAPLFVLCQTVFATALGFLFALIFYRGGSILPCIITHCIINITSIFLNEPAWTLPHSLLLYGIEIGMVLLYLLILLRTLPKENA